MKHGERMNLKIGLVYEKKNGSWLLFFIIIAIIFQMSFFKPLKTQVPQLFKIFLLTYL